MKKSKRDPSHFNPNGRTKLMNRAFAAKPGSYEDIRYAIEKERLCNHSEEEVTVTCKKGNILLHYALMEINTCDYKRAREKAMIARYLIHVCGVDPFKENKQGERPLDFISLKRAQEFRLPHLLEDELRGKANDSPCRHWASRNPYEILSL